MIKLAIGDEFDGSVDFARNDKIYGWYLIKGSQSRPELELVIDGAVVDTTILSECRPDISSVGADEVIFDYVITIDGLDIPDHATVEVKIAMTSSKLKSHALTFGDLKIFGGEAGISKIFTPVEVTQLLKGFESLGYNCEFGLVQRHFNVEGIGLLRWGSFRDELSGLLVALNAQFANVGQVVSYHLHGSEYISVDETYRLVFHTDRMVGSVNPDVLIQNERGRIAFLARNLLEDFVAASKIFVFKSRSITSVAEIEELLASLRRIGPVNLLWVTIADRPEQIGTVEFRAPHLLQGYIDRFSPDGDVPSYCSFDVWVRICDRARRLCESPLRPVGMAPELVD